MIVCERLLTNLNGRGHFGSSNKSAVLAFVQLHFHGSGAGPEVTTL